MNNFERRTYTDYDIKCRISSLRSICSFISIPARLASANEAGGSALTIVRFLIFCGIKNHNWYNIMNLTLLTLIIIVSVVVAILIVLLLYQLLNEMRLAQFHCYNG